VSRHMDEDRMSVRTPKMTVMRLRRSRASGAWSRCGVGADCYPQGMQPVKATVRALLEKLPDDCSLEDVLYHLYVFQKVEAGLADAEAGKLIPHEEVAEELRRKWVTGAA
jgi:hypothetical protein